MPLTAARSTASHAQSARNRGAWRGNRRLCRSFTRVYLLRCVIVTILVRLTIVTCGTLGHTWCMPGVWDGLSAAAVAETLRQVARQRLIVGQMQPMEYDTGQHRDVV